MVLELEKEQDLMSKILKTIVFPGFTPVISIPMFREERGICVGQTLKHLEEGCQRTILGDAVRDPPVISVLGLS